MAKPYRALKNLYHIAEDVSKASGGIRTVVLDLKKHFSESHVLTTAKEDADDTIEEFPKKSPWLYSSQLQERLSTIEDMSLFHIHGVWMHAQYAAAQIASQKKIPFIVSPHGMYEPWLWKEGKIKKNLYFKLFSCSAFAKANYLHAITPDEKRNLQQLFPTAKIVCIPNAIETQSLPPAIEQERPYFLFLGRLHAKKGIELLIESFHALKHLDFDLKIAGSLNPYSSTLQRKVLALGDNRIKFIGAVSGDIKQELYRNAHAFVAPSYSEVVGMVNLEAAMMATPVITTFQTGILREWKDNGGMLIHPEIEQLITGIKTASRWTSDERESNGLKLRDFVIEHYSWESVRPQWEALYRKLSE